MAAPFTKEYVTLDYHPQTPMTADALRDLVRLIEGYMQRIQGRIEALQQAVTALETRVRALE